MLVLSRKVDEEIHIGDNITITVIQTSSGRVRLGITAPDTVRIRRDNMVDDPEKERVQKAK